LAQEVGGGLWSSFCKNKREGVPTLVKVNQQSLSAVGMSIKRRKKKLNYLQNHQGVWPGEGGLLYKKNGKISETGSCSKSIKRKEGRPKTA